MLFHLCLSSTDLPHYGALLVPFSWVSFGSKVLEGDTIQHKKIQFPVRSPDVSATSSWICEVLSGQGCTTNKAEEKGP